MVVFADYSRELVIIFILILACNCLAGCILDGQQGSFCLVFGRDKCPQQSGIDSTGAVLFVGCLEVLCGATYNL